MFLKQTSDVHQNAIPRKQINDYDGTLPARVNAKLSKKIYTKCSDSDMKDHKQIDHTLKLYIDAQYMIIDKDDISKGQVCGKLYRVVGVQRNTHQSLEWKNCDGRKVYTTNIHGVEFIEFEHLLKKHEQIALENQISLFQDDLSNDSSSFEITTLKTKLRKFILSKGSSSFQNNRYFLFQK